MTSGTKTFPTIACTVLLSALLLAGAATAGLIEREIADLEDGTLRIEFASREGVCGDGGNFISLDGDRHFCGDWTNDDDWKEDCIEGPVRVTMRLRDGDVTRIKTSVGHDPDRTVKGSFLSDVDPEVAVRFLLRVARTARESVAEDAIFPCTLARDVEVWPELMEIARDDGVNGEVREQAVFWMGQAAGEKVTRGLARLVDDDDEDLEVREAAVFGLSQRDSDEAVPALMDIALENKHPQLREVALFWLGQHDDPRVLDLFEEILLGD